MFDSGSEFTYECDQYTCDEGLPVKTGINDTCEHLIYFSAFL